MSEEKKSEEKSYTTMRDIISVGYLLLPLIIAYLHWGRGIIDECWFRPIFPMLAGFWGLAMRGIAFRKYPSNPCPFYITLYPLAIVMHGLLIYTVLSLFYHFQGHLFFTADLPLGMFFGFYAHPSDWPIGWIFKTAIEKIFKNGDKALKS
jgi:hypothetical protein